MSIGSLADYQVMFIPTATLAFELSGMHSLLILPSKWSMPMNKLYPLGWMLSTQPMLAVKLLTAKLTPPSIHFRGAQLALSLPSVHE